MCACAPDPVLEPLSDLQIIFGQWLAAHFVLIGTLVDYMYGLQRLETKPMVDRVRSTFKCTAIPYTIQSELPFLDYMAPNPTRPSRPRVQTARP